ncbi:MAG TPA: penicillin-binding transpeptidase domain-containing protein [Thermoanaerobaculia bacterium]|nr:penicillin-binding transpeptidase domain-containing protein [Thermoanaerobaculia bacterium]
MRGFVGVAAAVNTQTGEPVVLAESDPSALDAEAPLLPLSIAKLWLAASWWDRAGGREPVSVHEMLVGGSDDDARELARALRKAAGTAPVVGDLRRFGATTTLTEATPENAWDDALSIGEANLETNLLRVSDFLRGVGGGTPMIRPDTARKLQSAMLDAVTRGTGREIANALSGTGWRIGGKTGTGPGSVGPQSDGWFAGLVFDGQGRPRYTVAAYVRRGGKGGGRAARVCAEIARTLAAAAERAGGGAKTP